MSDRRHPRQRRSGEGVCARSTPICAISMKCRSATDCTYLAGCLRMRSAMALWCPSRGCRARISSPRMRQLHRALRSISALAGLIRSPAIWPMIISARAPAFLPMSATQCGAPQVIPSNESNGWRCNWSPASCPAHRPGRAPREGTGLDRCRNCGPPLTPAVARRRPHSLKAWTVSSCGPVHPGRRRADGRMCCRPGVISSRSTFAQCRRHRHGASGNWRRNGWSRVIGRRQANGRARSHVGLGHRQYAHRR